MSKAVHTASKATSPALGGFPQGEEVVVAQSKTKPTGQLTLLYVLNLLGVTNYDEPCSMNVQAHNIDWKQLCFGLLRQISEYLLF